MQSYDCNPWYGCVPRYDNLGSLSSCDTCQQRFYCNPYYGCDWMGYGVSGMSSSDCSANCVISSYDCNAYGCVPRYDNLGALQNCDACLERYVCDATQGCISSGYDITGASLSECQQTCTIQSYDCHPWYGCVPRYDTLGALTDCSSCQPNYICYESYYDFGDGNGPINYSTCYNNGYTANNPQNAATCCSSEPCASSIYNTTYSMCPSYY